MSCVTLLEDDSWRPTPGFLQALLCILFPLADLYIPSRVEIPNEISKNMLTIKKIKVNFTDSNPRIAL